MAKKSRDVPFFWLVIALAAAELTCSLESGMIYVVLSPLHEEYGDPVRIGWLVTGFTLASAAAAALCGRLGDLFGRRRLLLIMLVTAFAGSALSGLAGNLDLVIVGRALQGASTAILPLCFGLLRENCEPAQVTKGVALMGGTYSIGSGLGLVIGGVIVDTLYWQWIFACSSAAALLAILLVLRFVPKSPSSHDGGKLDIWGGILFAPAVAMVLLAITLASSGGWTDRTAQLLALGGLAMLALWVWHELRQEKPLIDVRLLKDPRIMFANLCMFFTSAGPMLFPLVVMPLLQQPTWTGVGFGVAATLAAFIKLPANFSSALAVVFAGQAATRFGTRLVLAWCAGFLALGWASMVFFSSSLVFVAAMMLICLAPAVAILFSMIPRIVMEAAPEDRTSEATGLTQVVRAVGQATASQVLASILATSMVTAPGISGALPDRTAFMRTFIYMGGFSVLAMLTLIALGYWQRRRAEKQPTQSPSACRLT